MEVELLWPLVQELIGEGPLSEEDRAFLQQNAQSLGCPEEVLTSLIAIRQATNQPDPTRRLKALTDFIECLGTESGKKLNFLLEITDYLHVPVEIIQALIRIPRKPVLPFTVRLWRSLPRTSDRSGYEAWFRSVASGHGLSTEMLSPLLGLLEAVETKQTLAALKNLWQLLSVMFALPDYPGERAYLMELAREARLNEALVRGMENFLRLRAKGQSAIECMAELTQELSQKGPLTPEEQELLGLIAAESGISEGLLQALIALAESIRREGALKASAQFGGEILEPFLRQLLMAQVEAESQSLIYRYAATLGLSRPQVEAIMELEKHILNKTAKFPQNLQPLIRVLVEKGQISDAKLLYLARKAQEMGGSEKVVRALVQIEITAQRKAQEPPVLKPPSVEPSSPELQGPPAAPPATPIRAADPTPEPLNPGLAPRSSPPSSLISDIKAAAVLPQTFPKGGNFPPPTASFSVITAISLRSEKDRLVKCEIFPRSGRAHWYAVVDYEGAYGLLIIKGKPEQRLGEILQVASSHTGEVVVIKERMPGGIRVHLNDDQSVLYEEVGNFVFSPNGRHVAYVAAKGQDQYPILDNVACNYYPYVTELVFHPTAENDLYFIAQIEKNKWSVLDSLGRPHSETFPMLRLLTFSPDGRQLAYAYLKERKFRVFDGRQSGPPYDSIGDLQFSSNGAHILYSAQKGKSVEVVWDHKTLCSADGILNLTLSPDGEFVAWVAREKDGYAVYLHDRKLGTYEKVEKLLIPRASRPTLIYVVEYGDRHHIFINGAPESGPYERIIQLSGRGESFAAIVRKDKDTMAVVRNGQLEGSYTTISQIFWDSSGKNLAYPARRKGSWSGVVWNGRESDHYEYPQHLTFGAGGKALLFFARRRDGWYAVLNDQPIPESLCAEILAAPIFDEKSQSFYYLCRREKEILEARISLRG